MDDFAVTVAKQRQQLVDDPHRPHFHFLPPANWMNDPNGLIQWKGQYHLFYQYNPHAPIHRHVHWGHAVSSDLVHWTDLPVALTPTTGRADGDGCWSGSAVNNDGVPTLLYSGVHPQVVCLATSEDDLLTWHYHAGNPVIEGPPTDLAVAAGGDFRDPYAWREGDFWYLIMGSRSKGIGGTLLLYRSHDLTQWEYLHPLMPEDIRQDELFWTGAVWECPNFLTFAHQQRLLIFSTQAEDGKLMYPVYVTGTFQDEQFIPQTQGMLTYGNYFYAPQVLYDDQGRYIMWGWLREGQPTRSFAESDAGWAGVMSLPILVSLRDGQLQLDPAPELKDLREKHWHAEGLDLQEAGVALEYDIPGQRLEIMAEFDLDESCEFGFKVRCSDDGQEETHIVYQAASERIALVRAKSSLHPDVDREDAAMPVVLEADRRLKLHIFLDHSTLEIFANGRYLASRIYPVHTQSVSPELFVLQGNVRVKALDIWSLASIWHKQ